MKYNKTLMMAASCAAAVGLSAQTWHLVDNMDDGDLDPWVITLGNNIIGELPGYEDGDESYLELIYPEGFEQGTANENPALNLESGGYGYANQYGTVFSVCPLPIEVADGNDSTFYFQYYQQGNSNEFHIGLTTLDLVPIPEQDIVEPIRALYSQPNTYPHYSFLFRSTNETGFGIRDGNGYVQHPTLLLDSYVWYEIWLVAHNRTGDTQSRTGDTWEIWIKGGQFDEATRVEIPPAQEYDPFGNPNPWNTEAVWRNPSTEPLRYVMYTSQTGAPDRPNNGDPHLIDDLYYTEGMVVETPPNATVRLDPETWGGYIIYTEDDVPMVETGGFLGLVGLIEADEGFEPWVYSYTLESWVYADEAIIGSLGGGWVYVFK